MNIKITWIKNAVGAFNSQIGAARIYFDKEELKVWTNTYPSGQSWDDYHDKNIIEIYAKLDMQDQWDKITMKQLTNMAIEVMQND